MPMIDTGNDLPSLIRALGDSDSAARESAASKIFTRGSELARPALVQWLAYEDLARCFVLRPSGLPEETVGLAVAPLNFGRIRAACGSPPLADVPPDQDALEFELEFPGRIRLDILTTRQPEGSGAIARYLQKFGQGIQQVELLARDVDTATQILRARFGLVPLFPATRAGANRTRVNFFLVTVSSAEKVLLELVGAGTTA